MSNSDGILATLVQILQRLLGSDRAPRTVNRPRRPVARLRTARVSSTTESIRSEPDRQRTPGSAASTRSLATVRIDPFGIDDLQVAYAPDRDGAPDAGEIVWTWVPYAENDGRGKDRPVLVIGRASSDRVYAVRMTSKGHAGYGDFLSIGSGAWDSQGRESWVDIESLYSVHEHGLRREAAALQRGLYDRVAAALVARYGWSAQR